MTDKLLSMLGLAKKAGALQIGAFLTEKAIREGRCELIVLASDTAKNNRKKFIDSAARYNIALIEYSTKEELSGILGGKNVVAAGVTDKNFAAGIIKKYEFLCKTKENTK